MLQPRLPASSPPGGSPIPSREASRSLTAPVEQAFSLGREYDIQVDRRNGKLGIDLDDRLVIKRIHPGDAIHMHNLSNPNTTVHEGDQFLIVNGFRVTSKDQFGHVLRGSPPILTAKLRQQVMRKTIS